MMQEDQDDQSSEGNFRRFLAYRGIKRVPREEPRLASENVNQHNRGNTSSQELLNQTIERIVQGLISPRHGDREPEQEEGNDGNEEMDDHSESEELDREADVFDNDDLADFDAGRENVNIIAGGEVTMDADLFYVHRQVSFGTTFDTFRFSASESDNESDISDDPAYVKPISTTDDSNIEYKLVNKTGDRRFSNNSSERALRNIRTVGLPNQDHQLPLNDQDAFTKWDIHDSIKTKEIKDNRGIYNEFDPDLSRLEFNDPSKIVKLAPGAIFRDSLELNHLNIKKLALESVKKYKNNISTIIFDSEGEDYLVVASNSELVVFDFDNVTHMPNTRPALRFDTRPAITSTPDRLVSTWPQFPHTINFLKASENFAGKPILAACVDDGALLIWFNDTILHYVRHFSSTKRTVLQDDDIYNDNNRFFGLKIKPDFKIKMESSLWGLDFLSYRDDFGILHNLIAASDNSQMVTFIYYDTLSEEFYHVKTHQILHNIPEVSIINHEILGNRTHEVKVSCASISAELIIFRFRFRIIEGPTNASEGNNFNRKSVYYIDPAMAPLEQPELASLEDSERTRFYRVSFMNPKVIARTLLDEDCWTSKPIKSKFFNEVSSISAVFGDSSIDEENEVEHIYNESSLLDLVYDPVQTSHLGDAARWQFFETRTLSLTEATQAHESITESAKLTGVDDEYRRLNKGLSKIYQNLEGKDKKLSLNKKSYRCDLRDSQEITYLAVSTNRRLGLFQADNLYCNAATKRVFDLAIPANEESKFTNRISITHIIPQLSCFIAVTQQGLITILRFCSHRGVFGMRQEHLFPNAISLALGYNGFRSIAGISVRDRSTCEELPRFFLYVMYTDGLVVAYELTQKSATDFGSFIV